MRVMVRELDRGCYHAGPKIKPTLFDTLHKKFTFTYIYRPRLVHFPPSDTSASDSSMLEFERYINFVIIIIIIIITAGAWHETAIEVTREIGKHITVVTEDTRETEFLFQRLSMALQRGNAVSFQNTMIAE